MGVALGYQPTSSPKPVDPGTTLSVIAMTSPTTSLMEQGRQAYKDQRFTDAIATWSQAVEMLQSQNIILEQALAFSYLTAAYQKLGQWEAASHSIQQSLDFLPTKTKSPLEHRIKAQVYNTQGSLQLAQGDTQSALETWQYAASLYAQSGDQARYLNNLINQVQALQSLGYYRQARNTLTTIEEGLPGQEQSLQIRGYQRLGQIYRLIGDLDTAQIHLQKALQLAQQQSENLDSILLELGNTYQAQGDLSQAISRYQQVVDQTNQIDIRIKARLNQLKLWVKTNPDIAQKTIATLPTDLAKLQSGRGQIYAYIHAAQSLLQLEDSHSIEISAHLLVRAIQLSRELQDGRAEAYAKGYLGHVYEVTHQWTDAQTLTEEALDLAQGINATDIVYQWQWQLGRLLTQQNQREPALQAYRQAFSTLRSLRQDLVAIRQDLQFSFRDSIEPVYREYVDLLLQSDKAVSINQSHQSRLKEAREVLESLQVAELDNFFRTACLEAQQVPLEEVRQSNNNDTAIIYPIILSNRLEIIVSLPEQPLKQYTVTVEQTTLEQTLIDWRQNLEKPFTTPEGKALGQALYSWLIQPFHSDLTETNIKTLAFVLDGALRNVPMAALYDGKHYLVEDYAVALSPGLQLLGPRPLQETNVTALLAGLTEARHGFSPLLNVDHELQTVSNLVNSRLLLNEAFTTENFTQQVNQANQPIVHLATHGQFSSKADETFILAWNRPIPVNELSTLLTAGDLNRREPIELLILSACETAAGDSRAALGLAGVALQSGTRSTLASLWNLDDASGAVFIKQFYQALTRIETTKAEALQQAQLKLLNNPNYRHPTYWAAYVLVGNWL